MECMCFEKFLEERQRKHGVFQRYRIYFKRNRKAISDIWDDAEGTE